MPFGVEKLEWCGYPVVKNVEDMFISFDRMYERDRHTDGQTPHDDIGRACIASRGKTTLCSEKNTHFCFLAYLLEKVTNLNVSFRQKANEIADSNSIK